MFIQSPMSGNIFNKIKDINQRVNGGGTNRTGPSCRWVGQWSCRARQHRPSTNSPLTLHRRSPTLHRHSPMLSDAPRRSTDLHRRSTNAPPTTPLTHTDHFHRRSTDTHRQAHRPSGPISRASGPISGVSGPISGVSGPIGAASGPIGAASGPIGAVSGLIGGVSGLIGAASGPTVVPDKITLSGLPTPSPVLFVPPPYIYIKNK